MPATPYHFLSVIERCRECMAACGALLSEAGEALPRDVSSLVIDCSDICRLTMAFLERNSASAEALCRACASICMKAANECDQAREASFETCARACRQCAEECDRIAHGWLGSKKDEPTGGPYAA